MFKAIFFYRALLCVVSVTHFIDVLSIPHLNKESELIYKTITYSVLLVVGTFSNILTIRYLSNKSIYKNHFAYLWILILLAITFEYILRYIFYLNKHLNKYSFLVSVYWINFIVHYLDMLRVVSVAAIAVLRLLRFFTGKWLNRLHFKIEIILLLVFVATSCSVMGWALDGNGSSTRRRIKYTIEGILPGNLFLLVFLSESTMMAVRHVKKVNEQFEFSFTCFISLFIMSIYKSITYFLIKSFTKLGHVQDEWSWIVFASYGLVMYILDMDFKNLCRENIKVLSVESLLHLILICMRLHFKYYKNSTGPY